MGSRWADLVVDAIDPPRLAQWWASVLDYRLLYESSDEATIGPDEDSRPTITFIHVLDAKSGKNRLHLDLSPDDRDGEVERLVNMGARRVDVGQPDDAAWTVLADPEGNEFCVLRAKAR